MRSFAKFNLTKGDPTQNSHTKFNKSKLTERKTKASGTLQTIILTNFYLNSIKYIRSFVTIFFSHKNMINITK